MEDIQSWYEVPSIAHFCSLFRAAFSLVDFDIEELEEALLMDAAEDMGSSLIQDLIVRLLNGTLNTNDVTSSNYQMFLRRLFRQKFNDKEKQKNPFNSDVDFRFLPLRTKVEILHFLCDCRLEAEDVMEVLKNLEADSLRVEPLGYDDSRAAYWYFYGTRLYKEENALPLEEEETDKSKKKGKKRSSKEGASSRGPWMVACFSEEDWRQLCKSLANASSKNEKTLYRTLKEDFLPEIPNLFAEKERQQRKRLSEMAPRRASTRIEKLKQQREEQDRIVAVAIQSELQNVEREGNDGVGEPGEPEDDDDEEEKPNKPQPEPMAKPKAKKSIDEDEWLMLKNKADRATRALLREISRDNVDLFSSFDSTRSRTGSADSTVIEKGVDKVNESDSSPEKPLVKKEPIERSEKVHKLEKNDRSGSGSGKSSTKHKQHETENKPVKRSESKNVEAKSNRGSTSTSAAEPSVAKSNSHKKGRQTNNSLSSVIEPNAAGSLKENGVRYHHHRVSPSLSATTDEAKIGMYKILEQIKNHPDAWPFLDPVDEDFAPDYYTKISQPMDLEKMEQRVSSKYYQSINEFMTDFDLIVDNCKKYNGLESEYSFMVDSLSEEFRMLASRYLNSVYEREPVMSGSEDSDCSSASDESSHHKRKSAVPDAKKRGGLMKLAHSLSGGNRSGQQKSTTAAATAAAAAAANKVKLKTEDVWDTPSPDSSETELKNRKSSKSREKADKKKGKNKKPPLGGRNLDALNALAAATEQTLKDMNKWLDDTPKFSEYSSGNSSPVNEKVSAKEFESLSERVEEEYRKQSRSKQQDQSPAKSPKKHKSSQSKKKGLLILAGKGRLPPAESKEERDHKLKRKKKLKKEKLMDSLFDTLSEKADKEQPPPAAAVEPKTSGNGATKEKSEKPARKTFERLQSGGKSKLSKVSRPDESKLSSVIAKIKESRSSALQKQTETIQKAQLSLGTVLFGGEIGTNKTPKTEKDSTSDEKKKKETNETENSTPESQETLSDEMKKKPTEEEKEKDDEPEELEKPVVVEAKHSATPNLSAWFKAFGAPKNPIKRQMSETTQETKTQAPPFKKGIGQHAHSHDSGHSSKADLPWYARLEKKDSSRAEPSSSVKESVPVAVQPSTQDDRNETEESITNRGLTNHMDPSSPADSMGSLNSPASAESIKSPSTPGGGNWGGGSRGYPGSDNPPVRSPLTPETQSFSPSMVPHPPIKVGFYQDMQALKGASPSHAKSPSCHSNSSGTGPNSPNDHAADQQQHHHQQHLLHQQQQIQQQQQYQMHQQQQQQLQQQQQQRSSFAVESSSHEEKHMESYPLKKRSTPAMSTHSPSPIVTPTPIHAARPPTGPPMHHDHNRINTPQPQSSTSYGSGGFNPTDYGAPGAGVVRSARTTPGPPPQQQQAQVQQHHQPPTHPELQLNQYNQYSSYGQPPNSLPGNLASLSQIVARIPTGSAAAAAATAPHTTSPEMQQHHQQLMSHQLQHQQHQQQMQQQHHQQQQQQLAQHQHQQQQQQSKRNQQHQPDIAQQQRPGYPPNPVGGYSYPPQQPQSTTSSSTAVPTERTSSLVASNPNPFPGSHKAPNSSAPTSTSSSRTSNAQDPVHMPMTDYGGNPVASYSSQPGVFYPQATPAYRPQQQQTQHQQIPPQQQQQQQQQPPQQQQQQQQQQANRQQPAAGQVFNSFDPNNHSFMWNSRPEQVASGHANSVAPTSNAYGRPPSGSNPFPSTLSYEHHHHMSGSLLFSGLDPLAASNASMFARSPLARSSPWAPPLGLETNTTPAPTASRSQSQQQQPIPTTTTTTTKATTTRKKNAAARAEAARAEAARVEAAAAAAAAAAASAASSAPGSAFNYNVQGLTPSASAGGSDALSASLYDRHRGASQAPPPAHQGSSAISAHHHQYAAAAAASGNHHFAPGPGAAAAGMTPSFGEYQPPHHPLAEHAQSSALYQQLLQRQQEELMLRNPHHPGMMLHQPGLLGSPAAYPPSFSSGLGLQPGFQPGWL